MQGLWVMSMGLSPFHVLLDLVRRAQNKVHERLLMDIGGAFLEAHALGRMLNVTYNHWIERSWKVEDGVNALVAFKAEDLRDKVYAELGLVDDGDDSGTLSVDYSLSVQQVYAMAARHFIKTTESLDFRARRNRYREKNSQPAFLGSRLVQLSPVWRQLFFPE